MAQPTAAAAGVTAAAAHAPALCSPRPPMAQGSTARRDLLLSLQNAAQSKWESAKAFDIDAPAQGSGTPAEKFFGTFPYPYMNGVLHLGHAFSLSKLEFASAYHRLCGKNVLFAQGFHCTGMPIKVRRAVGRRSCPAVACCVPASLHVSVMDGGCVPSNVGDVGCWQQAQGVPPRPNCHQAATAAAKVPRIHRPAAGLR